MEKCIQSYRKMQWHSDWSKIFALNEMLQALLKQQDALLATQGSLPLSLCWKRRWLPMTVAHDLLDLRPETKDHQNLRTKRVRLKELLTTKVQPHSGKACHSPAASPDRQSIDPSEVAQCHLRKESNSQPLAGANLPAQQQGLPPKTQDHQQQVQIHQEHLQQQDLQKFWLSKLQLPSSCAHHHWHQQKLIWPFPSAWRRSIDSDWLSPSSSWMAALVADPDESHSRSPSSSWRPQASQGW